MSEEKPKVDVNVVQVVASALAAVSSAVLLSTVGVAGTLIGAAVGSVVATVAGAVYSYSLEASRSRVAAAAQLAASARVRRPGRDRTRQVPTDEQPEQPAQQAGPAWRETLAALPWARVALVAAGVFVAAMVVIVSFELIAGKPVSKLTNGTTGDRSGTSIPGLGGSDKPTRTPTETSSPAQTTGESPTSATESPSASPSESATPSETPVASQSASTPAPESPSASVSATPLP